MEEASKKSEQSQILKKLSALCADKRSYYKRLLMSAASVFAFCFTFIFFGPFELVAFGRESLVYGYKDIFWILALATLITTAALSPLIALLKGRIYNYIVCFISATTLAGYIQSLLLNGSLGTLTGDAIDWTNMRSELVLSLVVWLLIYIAFYFVMYLSRDIWKKVIYSCAGLLVLIQFVPTVGIFLGVFDLGGVDMNGCTLTTKGMYEYSTNDNVLVFVLDRLDYDYIEEVKKEDPDFFNKLDGFIEYDNAISAFARTKPALNHLMTGCEDLAYNVPTEQFFKDSWTQNGKDILRDLDSENYTSEFYTDITAVFSDGDYVEKYVANSNVGSKKMQKLNTLKKLLELSAYRYAPTCIKPFYWADTNYFNRDVLVSDDSRTYIFDDASYADGFKTAVSTRKENNFKLYHFDGPHAPYTLNSDGTRNDGETSRVEQLMGCMNILYNAFDRMKELGIYDDATIIITGDHGMHQGDTQPVLEPTLTGIFYKPANSSGDGIVKVSHAQVSTANIPATILKAAGADYSLYGKALDDIGEDETVTRYYYKSACESGSSNEIKVYVYEVIGDANDFNSWHLIRTDDITDDKNKFH